MAAVSLLDSSIASLEQAAQLAPAGAATSDGWAVAAEGVEAPWSSKAAGFPTTGALAQAEAGAQPVSSWPTVLEWDAQALGLAEYAALPLLRAHASSPNSSWLRQLESDAAAGSGLPPQLLAPRPGQAGGAAPAPLLLLYRRDWLERLAAGDGVSGRRRSTAETRGASDLLPPTWDMLAQLLGSLVNRDLDGDSRPDHALCVDLLPGCKGGALLTAIWASLAQSGGTAQGLWFNSADMSPALDGPALPEALRLYAALAASNAAPFTPGGQELSRSTVPVTPEDLLAAGGALDPTSGTPPCGAINPLFAAGRCLFTIDWAPSAPRLAYQNVSGVLGAALLPGSLFVSSTSAARSTTMEGPKGPPRAAPPPPPPEPQQLLPCNPTRCPHAEPLAVTAALADAWGRYGVNLQGTGVGQAQQEAGAALWVNRAPLLGEAGDVWVLAPGQSPATAMRTAEFIRLAGYHLGLKYGALVNLSTSTGAPNSLLAAPSQALSDAAATLEMAPADVTALAQALAASVAHPNAAMDVLLPYSSSYRAALDELASGSLLATAAGNRSTDLPRLLEVTRTKFVATLQALPYPAITKTLYHHSIGLHTAATSGPEDGSSDRGWAVGVAVGVSVGGTALLVLAGLFLLWRLRLRPRAPLLSRGVKPPGPGPATTLALTDVQNSTLLWEVLSAELMDECMAIHHGVMRMAIESNYGYEAFTEGDAFAVAFHDPEDALAFAMDLQAALLVADWPPELLAHTDGCEVWARRCTHLPLPPPSPQRPSGLTSVALDGGIEEPRKAPNSGTHSRLTAGSRKLRQLLSGAASRTQSALMGSGAATAAPSEHLASAMGSQGAQPEHPDLLMGSPSDRGSHRRLALSSCQPRRRRSTTGAQLQAPPPSLLQLHPSLQAPGQPFSAATTASHHFASHSQTDSQLLAGTLGTGAVDSVAMASYSVGGASNSSGGGWYGRPRLLSGQGAAVVSRRSAGLASPGVPSPPPMLLPLPEDAIRLVAPEPDTPPSPWRTSQVHAPPGPSLAPLGTRFMRPPPLVSVADPLDHSSSGPHSAGQALARPAASPGQQGASGLLLPLKAPPLPPLPSSVRWVDSGAAQWKGQRRPPERHASSHAAFLPPQRFTTPSGSWSVVRDALRRPLAGLDEAAAEPAGSEAGGRLSQADTGPAMWLPSPPQAALTSTTARDLAAPGPNSAPPMAPSSCSTPPAPAATAPQGAAPPGAASPAGRPPSIPMSAAWRAALQPGVAAPALLSPIQSGQQWQTTSRAQAGLAAEAAASEHAAVQGTTVAAGVDARPESGQAGAAAAPDDELLARPRPVSLRKHSSWSAGSISVAAASALHSALGNEDPASARNSSSGGQGQDLLGAAEAGPARSEALDGVSAAGARWANGEPGAEPLSIGAHGLDPGRWDPRLVVPAEDETCVSEGIISAASIREQLLGAASSPGGDRGGGGGPVAAEGPPSAGTGASAGLREVSSAGVPALSSPFRFEGSNPSDSAPGLGPGSDEPLPKPEPKPQPRLQKQRAPAPHPSMPPPSASQQPLHGRSSKAPKVADSAAGQGGPEAALFGPMDHLMDDGLGKFLEWRAHVNWFDEEVVTAAFRHDVYGDGPAGGAGRRNRRQLPGQQRGDAASGPRPKGEPQQPRERPSQPRRLTLDLPRRRTLDGHDGLGAAPAGAAGRGLPRASSHGHGSSQAAVGQRAAQQQQQRPVLRGALSWARRGVSSLLSGSLGTPEATTSAEAGDPADAKVAPAAGADPSARLRRQGDSTGNATTSAPLPVMQDGSRRPRQDAEQSPQGSARPLAADKLAAAGSGLLSRISHATLQLLPIKARRNSRTPAAGSSSEAVPAVEIAAGSPPSASGIALSPGLIFLRKSTEGDGVHSGQARDGPTSGDQGAAAEPAPLISTTPAQDRDGRPSDPGAPAVSNTLTSNRQSLLRSIEVSASAWARTPSGAQEQASAPAPSPADLTPDTVSLGTVGMEAWRHDVTTVVPGGKLPSGVLSGTLSSYYKQQTQVSLQPMVTSASTQLSRKVISLMQHTGGAGILPQPSAPAGSSTADLFRDLNAAALLLASELSQATVGNQGSGTIAAHASSPQEEPIRRGPALWLHSAGATVAAAFKLLYERLTVEEVAEVRAQLEAADIGTRAFAGPGSGDPELVLRGLRIRVGLHSGPREGEVELAVVDRVEVARYKGDFLATAKEVGDAAVGGMVVLGGATFRAFQQLGRQRGRGRSDLSFLHLGEHQVKPPPDLDSTLVGLAQTQELSALFSSATSAHELFLAMCPGLLPRLALLPSPVRTHRETVPGFLSAPAGEVAPVFCNVLGVEALLSWEKVLQERSRMLRTQSNNLALSGRASLLGAFPSGSILGGRPPGDTLSEAGDSHGGLPGGGRRRARSGPVHAALGILRDSVVEAATRHGGYVVASSSDGGHWVLVFPAPEAAVQWGLEMLQAMLAADWPAGFLEHELTEEQWSDGVVVRRGLRLHIGIDYGRAMVRLVPRTGRLDYVGRPLNRAARIAAKAKAATVLVSDTVWNSVRPSMGAAVRGRSLGQVQLKGVREPLELWALQGAA